MKILFIKQKGEDYLADCVYHGLKSKFGRDVVSSADLDYMYKNYSDKTSLYGKGFTLFCDLDPTQKNVGSREEIKKSITNKEYDYIFYGSIWRCTDYLELVKQYYPANKVVVFDGEDSPRLHPLTNETVYFKRELENPGQIKVHPISFSIPAGKIVKNTLALKKIKDFGAVVPGQIDTYIFNNEEEYYEDYQKSRFGITVKKGGWDSMRHYEILANGCLPYFIELESCPPPTLHNFPKELVKQAYRLVGDFDQKKYDNLLTELHEYTKKNLTTEACVNYIFEILNKK